MSDFTNGVIVGLVVGFLSAVALAFIWGGDA